MLLKQHSYCEHFRAIRHLDITLIVCYKFGLSITVSWLLLNKSHWQHSSRVNITLMYHCVQEQLSMSVILGPSRLPFLFRVTWHTTEHIHLTATFTLSSLLFIWDTLLYILCVLFRSWTVEWHCYGIFSLSGKLSNCEVPYSVQSLFRTFCSIHYK